TPTRSSAATAIFMQGLVLLPARKFAAGELLQGGDVLAELRGERLEGRAGDLRLGCRGRLRVVDDLLDHPAHALRQAIEVAIEGAKARQLDQLLHELVAVGFLGRGALPLSLELLGVEVRVDAGELERLAHRPL